MKQAKQTRIAGLLALGLAVALAGAPAWADKGGHGQGKKQDDRGSRLDEKHEERGSSEVGRRESREVRVGSYFNEQDRNSARSYYQQQYGNAKSCPPGLAKKNNGCMPPGQAKNYAVGQPLPVGAVFYPVPQTVLMQLPPAPDGHKYVRVASDILLIAIGSQLVVDSISDLMRL